MIRPGTNNDLLRCTSVSSAACGVQPLTHRLPPACPTLACPDCRGIEGSPVIADIRRRVEEWAGSFPMPGFDVSGL